MVANRVKKVLIVDDEPDVLLMLRVNLESEGYSTALAADGETALRRVEEEHPDLMLLDVMMPVMDGWAVLESLAQADDPRIVVVSAKSSNRDIVRALSMGACDYVVKPFDPDELVRTVARVLASLRGELDAQRRKLMGDAGGVPS